MKTWTGFTGAADRAIRKAGRTFFVFEFYPCEFSVVENRTKARKIIKDQSWNGWTAIIATSQEKAIAAYDRAHDQWEKSLGDKI